jgi:hypothetical protein
VSQTPRPSLAPCEAPDARKRRRRPGKFLAVTHPLLPRTVETSDGSLSFALKAFAGGISVERVQVHGTAACVAQVLRFQEESAFRLWCEADPLRHALPLIYARLQRTGCELLRADSH